MNHKSKISNFVFTILVSFALILTAINPTAVRASKVTPPTKPPTATPTPTVTDTPVPTVEPVETVPAVSLQSDPTYITPGGQVTISYQITDFQKIVGAPGLRFYAPPGLTPVNPDEGKWDTESWTYYLPLTDIEGNVLWQADENITPPVTVFAELTQDGEAIAKAEVILDAMVEFKVEPSGGEADGMNGRVQVTFPGGAVSETVIVKVTRPSEESLPIPSLSGAPFEITAVSDSSKAEVSQFAAPVEIVVSYSDAGLTDDSSTMLYWYDEENGEWKLPLSQRLDTENNLIYATTDHFTVFDTYTSNWQSAETPTMSFFQTPGFTGAASFSMPIKVPPGPGGLQPSLSLSYSSSTVDNVSSESQASWAGMGWSIAESYIEHNNNGTQGSPIWTTVNGALQMIPKNVDDTYQLTLNGTSIRLFKDANDVYHAEDEQFYKVEYDPNAEAWIVWDKSGTKYTFGVMRSNFYVDHSGGNCHLDDSPWRWSLSEVENIHGQTMTYSYANETKVVAGCDTWVDVDHPTYAYPQAITYANGRYRVFFERIEANEANHRTDQKLVWFTNTSYLSFQRSLLEAIRVEQDANGDGTFETLIRKYQFTYCQSESCSIFPKQVWDMGGRTPTLVSVQEFGLNGTNSLPAYGFSYDDDMHLTSASNGYGGTITYIYNGVTNYALAPQAAWHDEEGGNPLKLDHSLDGWTGLAAYGNDTALLGGEAYYNQVKSYQPGRWYKVTAMAKSAGASSSLSLGYSNKVNGAWTVVDYSPAESLGQTWEIVESEPFFLPLDATGIKPYLKKMSGAFIVIDWVYLTPLPTYSRVTSRTLSTGSDNYTFTYNYADPHTNDPLVSDAVAQGDHLYDKAYTSFRGHASVTETDPYGKETMTAYYQDDVKTGRSSSVTIKDASDTILQVNTTAYNSSTLCTVTLIDVSDKNDPATYLQPYDALYCRNVYTTSETKSVYKNNGTIDDTLTTTYDTYDAYGNLTQKTQSGGGVTLVTHTDYFPNVTAWLVGLPARTWVTDGTNLLTESLTLYDGANLYTTPPTVGIPTASRSLIDLSQNRYSQTSMTRDAWGNVISQTSWSGYGTQSTAPTTGARTSYTTYDPTYHTYAVTSTDALGHSYNVTYDYSLGLPVSETDPNGTVTTATYDSFGRFTGLTKPGDSTPTLSVSYQESPYVVTLNQKVDATHTYTVVRTYDGMGREILTNTNGILVNYAYDAYGHAATQSMPHLSGETVYNIVTTYDALGRSLTATAPDGAITTTAYNGLTTTVTDASGRTTTSINDILGRNLSIAPPAGPAVSFTYDALGNMLTATRGGVTSTLTYDNAGRKLTMVDPDMGSWSYGYDALGSMTSQTDARGCTTNLAYDVLSRLTQKTYSNCPTSAPITYGYDSGTNGIGRKTSVSDESGLTVWTYDARGRVVTEAKQIGIYQFTTYFAYNSAELPTSITYPDGEVVNFTYNDQMLLESVVGSETYVQSIGYDSSARMTQLVRGNGVLSSVYDYYAWNQQGGRLQGLTTTRNSDQTTLQGLDYTYDPVGNILTITDSLAGPQTQTFTYDALDRLTSANVTGGVDGLYGEMYGYDSTTGNLTTKGGLTIQYGDSNHAHAATAATGTGVSNSYGYDANGNQTTRQVGGEIFTLVYDAENRLAEVKKNSVTIATFVYDGDGKRVKSVMDGETTLFVGEHYEEIVGGSETKYYNAGKTRVAMRKDGTLSFLLGDHLNSSSLTTNASGVKTAAMQYKAWGESRTWFNSLPTRYTFTAQYSYMDDPATNGVSEGFGLMYYGARWYDPALGRFTQPDAIIPPGPQGYDRYAYTNNNPVRYVDPTGHFVETVLDVISVGMDIADIAQNGLNFWNGAALVVDVAAMLIPCVPAVGAAVLAVKAASKVGAGADALKALSKADDLLDTAKRIAKLGDDAADLSPDVAKLAEAATKNPDAKVVSLGSDGVYQKPGHTYFELPLDVWNALGDKGKELVNSRFMYNQRDAAKSFVFDFGTHRPGPGAIMEMGILKNAVLDGIYKYVVVDGVGMYIPISP